MVYPRSDGECVTVLSIDGEVQGIVPAVLLNFLEDQLKEVEKENGGNPEDVRIADYFDVIGGTGTGSLVAAMLTKPSMLQPSRPQYDMSDIISFLREISSSNTFPDKDEQNIIVRAVNLACGAFGLLASTVSSILDPSKKFCTTFEEFWRRNWKADTYPAEVFDDQLKSKLDNTRLDQTLSDIVVPAYHFDSRRPLVFSTSQARKLHANFNEEVTLRDVVLSSSAIPTIFPLHSFKYSGKFGTFADANIVADNPTLLALSEGTRLYGSGPNYKNYLVLSLGTIKRRAPPCDIIVIPSALLDYISKRIWKGMKARVLQYMHIFFGDIIQMYTTQMLPSQLHEGLLNYLRIQKLMNQPVGFWN
ncbi:patatin-like protein 2 isoform X2 [Manihot esculenta]|uniref:Uncharacterized protein n=3 Tax=Manihot esculenta TaxID=3983 RepID=A0ACB7HND1_MANES|nr:patatin-like protein 2 isoform X2 [Manihot esculenta]KAG8653318.1 hypothetical protein MANES_05G012400v8 [Manihot esculenta]KAG8653319.1 hypothetical protein MANES_05G012400v8 [Manihot esculenta]OAY48878.1 hypothetical protein MANES_05G012400v8 [Manihot esculenta]